MLVPLQTTDGSGEVWVNPRYVIRVEPMWGDSGRVRPGICHLRIEAGGQFVDYLVNESCDAVASKLNARDSEPTPLDP